MTALQYSVEYRSGNNMQQMIVNKHCQYSNECYLQHAALREYVWVSESLGL
jgi:hypothetical protein